MSKRFHQLFPSLSCGVVFLFAALESAEAQYELRCRGGPKAFAIDAIDANTVSLRFTPGSSAAGSRSTGLGPGTCSWIDRAINSAEPSQIHFTADASKVALIARQLDEPGNYWSFLVVNTNQGFFEANSDAPWTNRQPINTDITSRTTNPDLTPRTTTAEITPRKSVLDLAGKPTIEKQTYKNEDLSLPVVTDVTAVPTGQSVTISFSTFPNTIPFVEVASAPPKKGPDRRWSFPRVAGMVAKAAGGDRVNGRYSVDMNRELDPGETYYYIISAWKDKDTPDAAKGQVTGKFVTPGQTVAYQVRYRGFYCYTPTNDTTFDDIYAIATVSFVDRSGYTHTLPAMLPPAIVTGVARAQSTPDDGRVIYEGSPVNLLLTVNLIKHRGGNPASFWQDATNSAEVGFGQFFSTHPEIIFDPPAGSSAVASALHTLDSLTSRSINFTTRMVQRTELVIASISRIISAREMKEIADQGGPKPPTSPIGVPSDFFTEHRAYGAAYRFYFDIIPQ